MPDVFDVLSKDHNEVKKTLAMLEKDRPGPDAGKNQLARRKKTVKTLIAAASKHEIVEEKFFWPAVRDKLSGGDKLASRAISQEDAAKEILAKLNELDAGDPEFEKALRKFTKVGLAHIQFEETKVWPQMRKALSDREAKDMGRKVTQGKKTAPARPRPPTRPRPPAQADGGKTRAELYEQAKKLGVEGRSSMNKEELARHITLAARSGTRGKRPAVGAAPASSRSDRPRGRPAPRVRRVGVTS
jgi:hemerythrin superfamily protein